MTNHELARAAAEKCLSWTHFEDADAIQLMARAISDTYAAPMAELEKLRRKVAFVKKESLLAIPSPWGSPSEIRCLLCKNTWWHECPPNHAADCPHSEVAT